jgi:hypothetical protein
VMAQVVDQIIVRHRFAGPGNDEGNRSFLPFGVVACARAFLPSGASYGPNLAPRYWRFPSRNRRVAFV